MRNQSGTPMRRFSALTLVLLLMMTCLIPACSAEGKENIITAPENVVRVLLTKAQAAQQLRIRTTGYYVEEGTGLALAPNAEATIVPAQGQLVLHCGALALPLGEQAMFCRRADENGALGGLHLNDRTGRYEGDLQLDVIEGEIRAILHIGLEDYLIGVVPYEMSDSFPLEALKVQAVAARTYALRKRDPQKPFDVEDNTNDQVYNGRNDNYTSAVVAVEATRGVCGYYKGELATCYYSASNGGQTALVEHVWGDDGTDQAYVDVRNDPYDLENPFSMVKRYSIAKKPGETGVGAALHTLIVAQLSEQLESRGYDTADENVRIDEVLSVKLGDPKFEGPSRLFTTIAMELKLSARRVLGGREEDDLFAATPVPLMATEGKIMPTPEPLQLSEFMPLSQSMTVTLPIFEGAEAAMEISISHMRNELWTVVDETDAFVVEARRYGHGVGMSQRGAEWMAGRYGKTYEEILAFYYPGAEFRQIETASATPEPMDMAYMATPGPTPSPTPRPTHMPVTMEAPEGAYFALVMNIEDDSSLNLRSEPSVSGEVLRRLLKGQRLLVEEVYEGGWVKVRTDVMDGYVMSEYLVKEDDLPETQQ